MIFPLSQISDLISIPLKLATQRRRRGPFSIRYFTRICKGASLEEGCDGKMMDGRSQDDDARI